MKQNPSKIALIFSTVCVLLLNLAALIEYWETGNPGRPFSTICYILGDICIVIGWIQFLLEKKKAK
ncbi:MAG: hypothetical protein IJ001_10805 [Oscillospiraceae bacterium]|nr:hypothetical protein [Oscillospiraceae bacterium]